MKVTRFWEKVIANSFYPTYVPNFFYFNNVERAKKITEEGRKALREMLKNL